MRGVSMVPPGVSRVRSASRAANASPSAPAGTSTTPGFVQNWPVPIVNDACLLAEGAAATSAAGGRAALWEVDASAAIVNTALTEEVFGPSTLLVRYESDRDLSRLLDAIDGQLTATVHASADELARHADVLRMLENKAGRVVFDQFPTGVEVCPAMVHGGPVPATSDGRSTSVGTRAIERFTRLTAFQNAPASVLPPELQDANPYGLTRLVNGRSTSEPVASA